MHKRKLFFTQPVLVAYVLYTVLLILLMPVAASGLFSTLVTLKNVEFHIRFHIGPVVTSCTKTKIPLVLGPNWCFGTITGQSDTKGDAIQWPNFIGITARRKATGSANCDQRCRSMSKSNALLAVQREHVRSMYTLRPKKRLGDR